MQMQFEKKTASPRRFNQMRERLSTVDLLVLTNSEKLLFKSKIIYVCCKTNNLNEEVNYTVPPPSVFCGLIMNVREAYLY
jgi:hypothetical protein